VAASGSRRARGGRDRDVRVSLVRATSRAGRAGVRSIAGVAVVAALSLLPLLPLVGALAAAPARAQHSGDTGTAPPPPPGDGRIVVQVVNRDGASDLGDLEIALYSLAADGRPGFTNGKTDADGRVAFERLSNDPGIVYLVGARYREIPFGARVTFDAGAKEASVSIEVSIPTERAEGVRIEELRVRFDWLGDRVRVREIVRLVNPGGRVIQLPASGTRALFRRRLAANAKDFELGSSSLGDGIALVDGAVRYVGPLYPGDQQIEYAYTLPSPAKGERLRVPVELDQKAARVVAIAGTSAMAISAPGLVASSEVESDSGTRLSAWARGALAAGETSFLELTLPETRIDASLVAIPRADVWLDLDDTRLDATADLEIEVAPGPPVAGTPEAPLFTVTLPQGASLSGVAPEAEGLGLVPRDHGGFDVIGPIGEGKTSLGFAYRLDAKPGGVALDLRFPRPVSTLNVLVADTGLALESGRLHRLRPFRSGTRNYLHREAFNVMPDEAVDLRLTPLRAGGLPREAGLAFVFAAVAGSALFMMAPLMRRTTPGAPSPDATLARLRDEREATYAAIADLDHDYETGKLDPADYASQRDALRSRAIELLRAERSGQDALGPTAAVATTAAASESTGASAGAGPRAAAHPAATPAATAATAAPHGAGFCPGCGAARQAEWRFCAGCGAALPAASGGVGA